MLALHQKQLLNEVEFLLLDLKTKIVDKILSSLHPTDETIADLWTKEVIKRRDQVEIGKAELIDGDEVYKTI